MSSHSRVAKKLSAIALSKQSPTEPWTARRPSLGSVSERVRRVLATLVAVMDDAVWAALPQRHVQRLENQFGAQVIGHRPAHNPSAEGVDDDRQEQESARSARRLYRKPTSGQAHQLRTYARRGPVLDEVCGRGVWSVFPCAWIPRPSSSLASTWRRVCGRCGCRRGEFGVNAGRSVSATTAMMDVADASLEDSIILSARRQITVSPGVVPAQGDAEQTGHLGDGEAGLIRSHEPKLCGYRAVSRANQAVAFAIFHVQDGAVGFHGAGGEAHHARRRQAVVTAAVVEIGLAYPLADGLRAALKVTGSSVADLPERTRSTIWWRNSGGYAGRGRGIVDSSS